MRKRLEIPKGTKFGRLTVIKEISPDVNANGRSKRKFKLRCVEGNIVECILDSLNSGRTTSCGCYNLERQKEAQKVRSDKSGVNHPLYDRHDLMIRRCLNPKHKDYKNYGGRGIKICREWLLPDGEGFHNYRRWAEANGWYEGCGLEVDRENNNKGYNPKNCRLITHKNNTRNTRKTKKVEVNGKSMSAGEAIDKYGVEGLISTTFINRLKRGWSIKRALTTPVNQKFNPYGNK